MSDAETRHRPFLIGTRSSPLARAQASEVVAAMRRSAANLRLEIVTLNTLGDRNKEVPLSSMDRGMFVREIDRALLNGEVDAAVHSAKDMPAKSSDGLVIAAICERRDPRDVLINRWSTTVRDLPTGSKIGTGSPRRIALLRNIRPDIEIIPIRGNVGTRVAKIDGENYDGVVVAAAGITRLGLDNSVAEYLNPEIFTPDVGQGALVVEIRADDQFALKIASSADHSTSHLAVTAERAFLTTIGGGCNVPITAYAQIAAGRLKVSAMVASTDGSTLFREHIYGNTEDPVGTGVELAERLLSSKASTIIGSSRE